MLLNKDFGLFWTNKHRKERGLKVKLGCEILSALEFGLPACSGVALRNLIA